MKSKLIVLGMLFSLATFSQAATTTPQVGSGTTGPLGTLDLSSVITTFDTSLGSLNSVTLMLGVDSTSNYTKFQNIHPASVWTIDLDPDTTSKFSVEFRNSALGIGVNKDMTMLTNTFNVPTYAGSDYVVPFTNNPTNGVAGYNSKDFNSASYDLSAFKGNGVTKVANMDILYNPIWNKSGPSIGDVDTITGTATVEWVVVYNYTVPEPTSAGLAVLGVAAFGLRRRRA
jgi:MYXO-CTERM domain-containing protein